MSALDDISPVAAFSGYTTNDNDSDTTDYMSQDSLYDFSTSKTPGSSKAKAQVSIKKWPFFPFIILLAFSYAKDDIEYYTIYFLFSYTSYECNFSEGFGIYLYASALSQVLILPLGSLITDRLAQKSTVILWIALLLEFIVEVIMYISILWNNFPLTLSLTLLRGIIHTQEALSIWKIFKQKLEYTCLQDTSVHDEIVSSIGTWAILGECLIDVYVYGTGYLLSSHRYSFTTVTIYIFLMSLLPTFFVFILAYFWFTPNFIRGWTENEKTEDAPAPENPFIDAPPESRSKCAEIFCHCGSLPEINLIERPNTAQKGNPIVGGLIYFKEALLHILNNQLCVGSLIQLILICFFWRLVGSVESLNLASAYTSNADPTRDNFCASEFINILYQAMWNNVIYIGGVIFYMLVLLHMKPTFYFRFFWPLTVLVFVGCIIPLFFSLLYQVEVIFVSVVSVLPYYFFRYNVYLSVASVTCNYLGTLQAIIGYTRYLTPILPGLFLYFNFSNVTALSVSIFILVLSFLHSGYFSWRSKYALLELSTKTPAHWFILLYTTVISKFRQLRAKK